MIDGGKLTPGPGNVPTIDGGQGQRRGSWSSCRGPHGPYGSHVPRGRARGADDRRRPVCRRSTAGKASAGEAGHRAAVPTVPTVRTCRAAVRVVPTIDAGQSADDRRRARPAPGKLVIVPRSPRSLRFARAARPCPWCRRSTPASLPTIDGGQGQRRGSWSSCRGPRGPYGSHVPPCPSIDNREADAGQAGHRSPGSAGASPAAVPVVPMIDAGQSADDRRREADGKASAGQAGHRSPGSVPRSPRPCPWCQ